MVAGNKPGTFQVTARYDPAEEMRELLMRKGVYPYEYMDSWVRFAEPKLPLPTPHPAKEAFFSKLSDQHISDEEYMHAPV